MVSGVLQYDISSYHSPIFLATITTSYVKSARCINVVPLTLFSTSTWLTCFDVYNIHSAEACRAMPHPAAWNKTRPSFIHSFIHRTTLFLLTTHTHTLVMACWKYSNFIYYCFVLQNVSSSKQLGARSEFLKEPVEILSQISFKWKDLM